MKCKRPPNANTNVKELVNSILMYSVLDPITVRPSGDGEGFVIISGHRRHRAVTKILDDQLTEELSKFEKIPCIIRETKDELLADLLNCSVDHLLGRGDRGTVSAADGTIVKDL